MIVVDASALVAVVLGAENAVQIWERLIPSADALHILHLTDLEVAQTLRRFVIQRQIKAENGAAALDAFRGLPLIRHMHMPLLERVWALRHNITAYDAAYVALAEALDAPLLTRDRKLANAGGHTARIEVI